MLIVAAFAAVLPQLAAAQVEKQVEVTKAYVPKVESASKLAVQPDMADTARLRPQIDYTITPPSLRTISTGIPRARSRAARAPPSARCWTCAPATTPRTR